MNKHKWISLINLLIYKFDPQSPLSCGLPLVLIMRRQYWLLLVCPGHWSQGRLLTGDTHRSYRQIPLVLDLPWLYNISICGMFKKMLRRQCWKHCHRRHTICLAGQRRAVLILHVIVRLCWSTAAMLPCYHVVEESYTGPQESWKILSLWPALYIFLSVVQSVLLSIHQFISCHPLALPLNSSQYFIYLIYLVQ